MEDYQFMTTERLIYALRAHLLNPQVAPTPDVVSAVEFTEADDGDADKGDALSFSVLMDNRDFRIVVSDITPDRSEEGAALDEYWRRLAAGEIDDEDDDPLPGWTWDK
jgi:cAMP phosphodiesterase